MANIHCTYNIFQFINSAKYNYNWYIEYLNYLNLVIKWNFPIGSPVKNGTIFLKKKKLTSG